MKKKYCSIDQNKLKILCDHLCDNVCDLLDHFELEYKQNQKFISMSCPIHGGDNMSAINLYYVGDSYRGNWKCRTHQCEKYFQSSIIGFVRGILSKKKYDWSQEGDQIVTFSETLQFVKDFTNLDPSKIRISTKDKEKHDFINSLSILTTAPKILTNNHLVRNDVRKLLRIPSEYFASRGFSPEILNKYDVGDCLNAHKEMSKRAVVPIYDIDYKYMIGCTGRSIYLKCNKCKCYHETSSACPDNEKKWLFPKWKHSKGFSAENSLYNFWFAKEQIQKSRTAILVESPGNVWKLEDCGIHNSLGMFGSNLNNKQKMLLDISGAMTLIIITDSDEAGESARQQIENKCKKTYNIKHIRVSKNDIAELNTEEIEKEILEKII